MHLKQLFGVDLKKNQSFNGLGIFSNLNLKNSLSLVPKKKQYPQAHCSIGNFIWDFLGTGIRLIDITPSESIHNGIDCGKSIKN